MLQGTNYRQAIADELKTKAKAQERASEPTQTQYSYTSDNVKPILDLKSQPGSTQPLYPSYRDSIAKTLNGPLSQAGMATQNDYTPADGSASTGSQSQTQGGSANQVIGDAGGLAGSYAINNYLTGQGAAAAGGQTAASGATAGATGAGAGGASAGGTAGGVTAGGAAAAAAIAAGVYGTIRGTGVNWDDYKEQGGMSREMGRRFSEGGLLTGIRDTVGRNSNIPGMDLIMNNYDHILGADYYMTPPGQLDLMVKPFGVSLWGDKDIDQRYRDRVRDYLEEIGASKDYKIDLANGQQYDIGVDGGNKLTNAAGEERNQYDIDWNDPVATKIVGLANGVVDALLPGDIGDKQRTDMIGYFTNAALSNANGSYEAAANNLASYMQSINANPADVQSKLKELLDAGDIDQNRYAADMAALTSLEKGTKLQFTDKDIQDAINSIKINGQSIQVTPPAGTILK